MAIKVVDPEVPSQEKKIIRSYKPLPMLPREEALRVRRATRNAVDSLQPWVLQEMIYLAENTEDDELRFKILSKLQGMGLSAKSNEEIDPDAPVVDGTKVNDAIAALEAQTENSGDGQE